MTDLPNGLQPLGVACVLGDGQLAVRACLERLHSGDHVVVLCRSANPFAMLVSEFHDRFLPVEIGNTTNVSLDQARDLIEASVGSVHRVVIAVAEGTGHGPLGTDPAVRSFVDQVVSRAPDVTVSFMTDEG